MSTVAHRLVLPLTAAVIVLLAGGGRPAAADPGECRHTDVVFYTTDTVRLANELARFGSPCAEYYLSVTPNATGGPRGGAPITTMRTLGHASTRLPRSASQCGAASPPRTAGTPRAWRFGG